MGKFAARVAVILLIWCVGMSLVFHSYGVVRLTSSMPSLVVQSDQRSRIDDTVARTAEVLKIPKPVIFIDQTSIPGYTLCSPADGHCDIHLGEFVVDPYFMDRPEAVSAVIRHEVGHAYLFARGSRWGALWPLCGFALAGAIAMVIAFKKVAMGIYASISLLLLDAALVTFSGGLIGIPAGFFLSLIAFAVIRFLLTAQIALSSRLWGALLPLAAAMIVALGFCWKNHEAEFHADQISVCTGPRGASASLSEALSHFGGIESPERILLSLFTDPLHPSLQSRIAAIAPSQRSNDGVQRCP